MDALQEYREWGFLADGRAAAFFHGSKNWVCGWLRVFVCMYHSTYLLTSSYMHSGACVASSEGSPSRTIVLESEGEKTLGEQVLEHI